MAEGATHVALFADNRKSAFTLAEVLITLGIIGVVAALTLPTLIQKYTNNVVETRLQKFYSSMNNAIKMAEVEYGDRDTWKLQDNSQDREEWINKYIAPYMGVAKIEIKNRHMIVYFKDGTGLSSSLGDNSSDWMFYPGNPKKCLVDKYNYDKPRVNGTCGFAFYYNPFIPNSMGWNFEPYTWGPNYIAWRDIPIDMLKNRPGWGCKSTTGWHAYCTAWIMQNGWKIPEDYPFKVSY